MTENDDYIPMSTGIDSFYKMSHKKSESYQFD